MTDTDTTGPLTMECPFCGWKTKEGEYQMLLHMETLHAEGDSPFLADQDRTSPPNGTGGSTGNDDDPEYVECPVDGCGEYLLLSQVEYHLELHTEETDVQDHHPPPDPTASSSSSSPSSPSLSKSSHKASEPSTRQSKAISAWKRLLKMPSSSSYSHHILRRRHDSKTPSDSDTKTRGKRLGRKHLGKYAHEDQMPDWLADLLRRKGQVQTAGVVPVLAQLLESSPSTNYAYLCHPCVYHISKLKREGGFCGYRNIQMLCSYLIQTSGTTIPNADKLGPSIPTIFQIQDYIEAAWDNNISATGRAETGGIRNTRKYIGTPEAVAMFRLLGIPFSAQSIKDKSPAIAVERLLKSVEEYFKGDEKAVVRGEGGKVRLTGLPPLYFQHLGHSMTIVGFEKGYGAGEGGDQEGEGKLLVFDPHFKDCHQVLSMVGREVGVRYPYPDGALKGYRRGAKYLGDFREFELLKWDSSWFQNVGLERGDGMGAVSRFETGGGTSEEDG
ncbi:peptidase family C78-domain-containing protein [Cercophora samala]|uniref:Peptidase family C78-domain-containing protein n=1 Tax=Cercophora samala TaxID=330535 RepID=A0AA39Z5G4_9PEZI|nr:peptidase family C78-domain-containing protein [Cercophora samala]